MTLFCALPRVFKGGKAQKYLKTCLAFPNFEGNEILPLRDFYGGGLSVACRIRSRDLGRAGAQGHSSRGLAAGQTAGASLGERAARIPQSGIYLAVHRLFPGGEGGV